MKSYIIYTFGGSNEYKGKTLKQAHQSLNLSDFEFNIFVGILQNTMQEIDIDNNIIEEVLIIIEK